MASNSRYPRGEVRSVRILDHALIDEQGIRHEQDRLLDPLSVDRAAASDADRLFELSGRDAPTEVTLDEFDRMLQTHEDPWLVRYTSSGSTIFGIDTSDCPA